MQLCMYVYKEQDSELMCQFCIRMSLKYLICMKVPQLEADNQLRI